MHLHNLQQGSDAWHQFRLQHYGASEAAAMLGISPNTSRTELLHAKHTGIAKEFSEFVQTHVLDKGHEVEALARPIVEELIGDDLFPVTCSSGKLSASCDGLTMDRLTAFEHKQHNKELAAAVAAGLLPEYHMAQCQQILMVTGAHRVVFVVSDGTRDRFVHMEVMPNLEWWGRIKAGWEQFDKDLAEFVPVEVVAAPTGKAPETLPALHIVLKGEVSASNLATFKDVALAAIRSVNRDLQTDQDFADSAKARKWCEDIESKVAAAKEHALGQTASIDELFRTMDEISAEARRVRLELDKLEKARNLAINGEIVADGVKQFADHMKALNAAMPGNYMPAIQVDFGGAIKGLRSVSSKKDAVATELARVKIIANEHATRIQANLKHLEERADAHRFLFSDIASIVLKAADDFQALVTNRINSHHAAEQKRLEAERERIRAEEMANLQREALEQQRAQEAQAKQVADEQRQQAARLEDERIKREQIEQVQAARIRDEELHSQAQAAIAAAAAPARVSPATPTDTGARLTLGQINERLEVVSVNTEQLARMGFTATVNRSARTYLESEFPRMCAVIQRHLIAVSQGVAA
jgi:putative phage-type endonuclease